MQYLLEKKELDKLVEKSRLDKMTEIRDLLRKAVIDVSGYHCGKTYCDDCPLIKYEIDNGRIDIRDLCNLSKQWSK